MKRLRISQATFWHYAKQGLIKRTKRGYQDDYDAQSVYRLLNKEVPRKTYLYARVSTTKQKKDLDNQITLLKTGAAANGHLIHGMYQDIASLAGSISRSGQIISN